MPRGFRAHLLLTLAAAALTLSAAAEPALNEIGVTQVPARPGIVQFEQVTFDYAVGRIAETDWGRIVIDPARLLRFGRGCGGYLNVFVPEASGRLAWVVDNVFVAGPEPHLCTGADQEGLNQAKRDDPFSATDEGAHSGIIPVVKYLDLRPGVEGEGRVAWISAVVWFSKSPVPNADEFLRMAESTERLRYPVGAVVENAEGDLIASPSGGISSATATSEPGAVASGSSRATPPRSKLAIGPPPQAVLTKPLAQLGFIPFPLGFFQESVPNVNAAKNQCVPAAHANALAYLEHRYNFNPNIWDLPHHHVRGIGKLTYYGDIPFYEPVPTWSIVANVDSFTMRAGVFDMDSGSGTGGCANFLGLLKYLHAFGGNAPVMQVRHQGAGNEVIGENADCDPGNLSIGGLQSLPEGLAPSWEWMRDQLQAGRSLVLGYGRYNDQGEWTGGHKVRVYGAAKYNGKKYLYMLDDSDQGNNFEGLRTFSFEVTDDHTPGSPGVPNGFLEFDSMANRQIVTVISVEPKPKYIFQ